MLKLRICPKRCEWRTTILIRRKLCSSNRCQYLLRLLQRSQFPNWPRNRAKRPPRFPRLDHPMAVPQFRHHPCPRSWQVQVSRLLRPRRHFHLRRHQQLLLCHLQRLLQSLRRRLRHPRSCQLEAPLFRQEPRRHHHHHHSWPQVKISPLQQPSLHHLLLCPHLCHPRHRPLWLLLPSKLVLRWSDRPVRLEIEHVFQAW
mmetsp:Transcript_202/g.365  ORF Transcript_202/g.365 Transcript_202/m.365 type:complete len:200 (+) Transcript_202:871-1470(+)